MGLERTSLISDANLVGYWDFNERTGTTLVDYKSANTLTATDSSIVGGSGKFGPGIKPDGTYYARRNTATAAIKPGNTQDFSISFWIRGSTGSGADFLFLAVMDPDDTNDDGFFISMSKATGTLSYFYAANTGVGDNHGTTLAITGLLDDNWHNVIMTFTGMSAGETIKTYKDSVLTDNKTISSGSGIAYSSGADLIVAKATPCRLDDLAMFNRILSQTDVDEIYASPGFTSSKSFIL